MRDNDLCNVVSAVAIVLVLCLIGGLLLKTSGVFDDTGTGHHLSNGRGLELGPVFVQMCARCLDVGNDVVVGVHGCFFQVAHKAVHRFWVYQVHRYEKRSHDHLGCNDEKTSGKVGVESVQASEQVHAFILRLFK